MTEQDEVTLSSSEEYVSVKLPNGETVDLAWSHARQLRNQLNEVIPNPRQRAKLQDAILAGLRDTDCLVRPKRFEVVKSVCTRIESAGIVVVGE